MTATLQGAPPDLQTALAAVEPGTGRVLAWYGGSLYGRSRDGMERYVDNVSQAKIQPGSSFKPVVLAAALSKGIGLRSQYDGSDKVKLPGYESGVPNDEGESPGWVDLPTATALSVNSVYVALGLDARLDSFVRTGHELRITSPLYGYSFLSLGTEPVRPIEMAAVYGTFAAGGVAATPTWSTASSTAAGGCCTRPPTTAAAPCRPR